MDLNGRLGRECIRAFQFYKSQDSSACRFIRMACDTLGPRGDEQCGCHQLWIMFCNNLLERPNAITSFRGNSFSNLFSAAAGLIHHREDIIQFFQRRPPSNLKQKSVEADARCDALNTMVLGLAVMFVYFTGPFWNLVNSMEVEAVTHAIQWLASQREARITHAIILTDSMNLLQKVESGMGCPDWHTAMHSLRLQRLLWIYCPGHAGVSGNERADRLASTTDITSGLQLGRAEVLRGLRNFLSTDKPEHHSIDRLKERGVEKGSGRHSTLQGRERSVFNQTNIGTVSRATLGRLLRDGAERVWAFPSATMPSWAETETEQQHPLPWPVSVHPAHAQLFEGTCSTSWSVHDWCSLWPWGSQATKLTSSQLCSSCPCKCWRKSKATVTGCV